MKKRLNALILAMLMILSICPVAMATAEYKPTIAKTVIYDAHITGNFVVGGTLTAEYSYTIDAAHTRLNETNTDATITWYAMNRYGQTTAALGTGKTYSIPEDYAYGSQHGIFFKVTATDGSSTPVAGNTYYSHFYNMPIAKAEEGAAEAPMVMNVGIVPQNPQGTMNVGDTVVARYTYREASGAEEEGTTFAWYTRDGLSGERSDVRGTGVTYEIQDDDFGKILEVDVTPVTKNETKGTTVTAMNHVGNLLFANDTIATMVNFRGYSNYREEYFLANGNSVTGNNLEKSVSGGMIFYSGNPQISFDLGKITPVGGIFVNTTASLTGLSAYTSDDGVTWSEQSIKTATIETSGKHEIPFDDVVYTRYLKVSLTTSKEDQIYDLYPYLDGNNWISSEETFACVSKGKIEIAAWNTPGNVIIENLKRNPSATLTITDSEGNTISDDFTVTEDLTGKYVKVTGADGNSALYEITYAGDIIEKTEEIKSVTSKTNVAVTDELADINLIGDDNAKYLFSTKLFVPENCDVKIGVLLSGNSWNTSCYNLDFLKFSNSDSGVYTSSGNKSYNTCSFVPGKWYDVNIILDYSTWNGMNATGTMEYSCWIDGVELRRSVSSTWPAVNRFTNDYLYINFNVGAGEHTAQAKDIRFRKLWNKDDFVVVNNYALNLKSGDTVVNDIEQGQSYEFENTMGVYKGTGFTNYLAVFDVTYDGGTETSRVLNSVVKNPTKIEINEGQEVRAFCFSDTLVPLVNMGEWK